VCSGLLNPHFGPYDLHRCCKSKDRDIKTSATNQQISTERLPPCRLCMICINEVSGIIQNCYGVRRLVINFRITEHKIRYYQVWIHCLLPVLLYIPTWQFNVPYSVIFVSVRCPEFVWVYDVLNLCECTMSWICVSVRCPEFSVGNVMNKLCLLHG
jgi:hypothetical protein